ncbi:MAG: MurT ligase domain-containing protein [Oscillospiraceae bacterium]|nr:MurT ligase domain-containing protein [Oscillospiraceae bacterium]
MRLRFYMALWTAKAVYRVMRLLGKTGSYLPGRLALRICPDYLRHVQRAEHIVCVSGTDGKTTTTNMTADLLEKCGYGPVVTNRTGSNTESGIAAAMTVSVTWRNRSRAKSVVLEVDEHYVPIVCPKIQADYLLVTALLRDSAQRNAHPEYVFNKINRTDQPTMQVILNADEMRSAALLPQNKRIYFGVGPLPGDTQAPENIINDYPLCPVCEHRLAYEYVHYAHIGKAYCPACGFHTPEADVLVTAVDRETMTIQVSIGGQEYDLPLINDALFNIYNEAAIIALLTAMGTSPAVLRDTLGQIFPPETRLAYLQAGGVTIVRMLAKSNNSLPISLLFDHVRKAPGRKLVILAVDDASEYGSSERIGWIYDADHEFLNGNGIVQIAVTGRRCHDHMVRLLLAGVPEERLLCQADELEAVKTVTLTDIDTIFLLQDLTSYELALQVEEALTKRLEEAAT